MAVQTIRYFGIGPFRSTCARSRSVAIVGTRLVPGGTVERCRDSPAELHNGVDMGTNIFRIMTLITVGRLPRNVGSVADVRGMCRSPCWRIVVTDGAIRQGAAPRIGVFGRCGSAFCGWMLLCLSKKYQRRVFLSLRNQNFCRR